MSDILIKGMEIPKGCFFCPFNKHLDPDTDKCVLTRDAFDSTFRVIEHRRDNCPLFHVSPHGRLIDARELRQACYQHYEDFMNGKIDGETAILNIEKEIIVAPTIIPAGEGE